MPQATYPKFYKNGNRYTGVFSAINFLQIIKLNRTYTCSVGDNRLIVQDCAAFDTEITEAEFKAIVQEFGDSIDKKNKETCNETL